VISHLYDYYTTIIVVIVIYMSYYSALGSLNVFSQLLLVLCVPSLPPQAGVSATDHQRCPHDHSSEKGEIPAASCLLLHPALRCAGGWGRDRDLAPVRTWIKRTL